MADFTLRDLYQTELQDLYAAEQQIIGAMPTMMAATSSSELRDALDKHLGRTRVHVERLDLIFRLAGLAAPSQQTSPIEGLVRAGDTRIKRSEQPQVRDAALIAVAQHVEHYEIAGYGCARTWARQLGDREAANLLQQTLDEEGAADKELTRIAEAGINQAAREGAVSDVRPRSRLRYVDLADVRGQFSDLRVRNKADENLGRLDGFIVDSSGRPYYLVVDSGGWFAGRRYIVPVGKADLRRSDRTIVIDIDKDTFKRYPEFHRNAFLAMSDEEARRYEWRVLEAIDPQAARGASTDWDYDRLPYYGQPTWLGSDMWGTPEWRSERAERESSGRRDAPMTPEQRERERELIIAQEEFVVREEVVAREDTEPGPGEETGPGPEPSREKVRGKTDDKTR